MTFAPVGPCDPQFRTVSGTPASEKWASTVLSIERTAPSENSKPQARRTNCSPRLYTFVCVQPTGRFAAPAGLVPFTLSTYRPSGAVASAFAEAPCGGPSAGEACGVVVIVSCELATGVCR